MPELPEVETVRRGLAPHLEQRIIKRVILRRPDLRFPFPDGLAERIEGKQVQRIERRGKYLVFQIQDGIVLLNSLGMSGRWTLSGPGIAKFRGFVQAKYPSCSFLGLRANTAFDRTQ